LRTDAFNYHLPPELIAQSPAEPRDSSRLLVINADLGPGWVPETASGAGDEAEPTLEHRVFSDLPDYLRPGDLLVFNRTRVIPARLFGRKATGAAVEVLLLRPAGPGGGGGSECIGDGSERVWEALVRPGRRVRPGAELFFGDGPEGTRLRGEVLSRTETGGRVIRFTPADSSDDLQAVLERLGRIPLPPYITKPLDDPERYQTVYARTRGSVAAPTAGLHFTPELLERVSAAGVELAEVTLHIGLDTFRPVKEDRVEDHEMHTEWYELPPETARAVADCRRRGGRVVACGTTVVRTLEATADPRSPGLVSPNSGRTSLFIYPGYRFKVIDLMLTNFHLPRSTLLMLVSAFGGRERILAAYREATRRRYRFYSFGDATLIYPLPGVLEERRPQAEEPDRPPAAGARPGGGREQAT